jgi:multiple sugar transport system permease protein
MTARLAGSRAAVLATPVGAASAEAGRIASERRVVPTGRHRSRYLVAAICLVVITLMLAPITAAVLGSLKTPEEAAASPPLYLPTTLSLANYAKVYHYQAGLPAYLFNSLAVAFLTIVLCLGLAASAGYGLARFRLPAKELLFLVLLSGLMIPYQVLLTPLYLLLTRLGLANTHLGLAIVHTLLQLPFSVYLMRQSFEALPRELEDAALIDGCTHWQMLWRVFLPSTMPAVVTLVLFAFITSWNEFLAALILMGKETKFTIPIMLVGVRQGHFGAIDWAALQAGVVVSILPCLLIYLLLQRYYVSGLLTGAVK